MGVKYITKHCKPADRKRMLRGHFKIGTLHEYRRSEGGGLLSDTEEGLGNVGIKELTSPISLDLPNNIRIENVMCWHSGGNAINVSHNFHNIPVFCASRGNYNFERHMKIIKGHGDYPPNPEVTAFVVIDAEKFGRAMAKMSEVVLGQSIVHERAVIYKSREKLVGEKDAQKHFDARSQNDFYKMLPFIKPERFAIEEEIRFVVPLPRGKFGKVDPNFSRDFHIKIQRAFQSCVAFDGSHCPRPPSI